MKKILPISSSTLNVSRVSTWLYNQQKTELHCLEFFLEGNDNEFAYTQLHINHYPLYFKALESGNIIKIYDVEESEIAKEFPRTYFEELNITSMIDIPIKRNGEIIGVVCNEYTNINKTWTQEELDFSTTIAQTISLLIEKEERKKSDTLLKIQTKENEELLSLFDKGETVLFNRTNDEKYTVNYVSSNVEALLGYSQNDFLSSAVIFSECIYANDILQVMEEARAALDSKVNFFKHEPYRIVTKNKEIKWLLDHTLIVRDEQLKITNFISYISDITALKQKDEQLLAQSRLAQMGEMISMIAHQWRQPLTAISSTTANLETKIYLESFDLNTKEGQDEQNTYFLQRLEDIGGYVKNLTNTIDDFRNFYKPNKAVVTTTFKDISDKALRIIKASLESDGIELIFECHSHDEIIMHDNEMMQVVLNIFKNAQDNFKEKKIRYPQITIATQGNLLSITDNGGGIEDSIIEKIFDPYFSTKDEKNGTGLGLYMSKTIIEDHHNGTLEVQNTDDGVCFSIHLNTNES